MYQKIQNKHYFSILINNEIYFLDKLEDYIRNKILIRRIKPTSLVTIISTLKIFIYWSIANPVNKKEEVCIYLARFLKDQENGFKIDNNIYVKELDENITYEEINVKEKQSSTINKDKIIIEDYLKYSNQGLFNSFNLNKNIRGYKFRKKFNRGHDYGLKMGKISQSVFLNESSLIPRIRNSVKEDIKAFPFQLYEKLLEIAKPRELLIYLLCGACSARISQVLNLTLYDINYGNSQVWLIDPNSNDQLGFSGIGRKKFLKENYNINTSEDKPHKNIAFKSPIPLHFKKRLPLFWVSNTYKQLFFSSLVDYSFLPESSRVPKHPFFFVTRSGRRLTPQQVHASFKKCCEELKKDYPQFRIQLDGLGLHSLRHMFGTIMATIQSKIILNEDNLNIKITPEHIKIITQEAMGHRNINSTDIYFNRPWALDIELGEYLVEIFTQVMKNFSKEK